MALSTISSGRVEAISRVKHLTHRDLVLVAAKVPARTLAVLCPVTRNTFGPRPSLYLQQSPTVSVHYRVFRSDLFQVLPAMRSLCPLSLLASSVRVPPRQMQIGLSCGHSTVPIHQRIAKHRRILTVHLAGTSWFCIELSSRILSQAKYLEINRWRHMLEVAIQLSMISRRLVILGSRGNLGNAYI